MKDRIRFEVQSGRGGDGCVSFRREKFIPRGGPDGGDGGRGGHVVIKAIEKVPSLDSFRNNSIVKAGAGQPGGGTRCNGRHGEDITLEVPPGTSVLDADTGTLLGDLMNPGDKIQVAEGGAGGRGNIHFATPMNRVPRESEPGGPAAVRHIELVFSIPAEAAVVGLPGAGKSALVGAMTRSRTKVSDFPFTTRSIHIGVRQISPYQAFRILDMPALVEGSSEGRGIGNNFLVHLDRVRIVIFLLDPFEPEDATLSRQCEILKTEIAAFDESYSRKKVVAVVNKWDVACDETSDEMKLLKKTLGDTELFMISAETGEGVDELSARIMEILEAEEK